MHGANLNICLIYLDDIIVFSKTVPEHLTRLRILFDKLRCANLKLKPSKCNILRDKITFLGHVVSKVGIETDPEKTRSVDEWPRPRSVHDVRSFLGLCSYYRKFVQNFAIIAKPLHALTGKYIKFEWSMECEKAFVGLKKALTSALILAMPLDDAPYILDTDASNIALGAVLSQVQEGQERVIAYASRLLSKQEANYCTTRKEMLALVYYTQSFRQYLLGKPFIIRTDHAALQWLSKTPRPIGQQARWLEILQEFDYTIMHRPGRVHNNADALSRRVTCNQCKREDLGCQGKTFSEHERGGSAEIDDNETVGKYVYSVSIDKNKMNNSNVESDEHQKVSKVQTITFDEPELGSQWDILEMSKATSDDRELGIVKELLLKKEEREISPNEIFPCSRTVKLYWTQKDRLILKEGVIYRKWESEKDDLIHWQVIPPHSYRNEIISLAHEGPLNGHIGILKTQIKIQKFAYWVGWKNDVEKFILTCENCARYFRGKPVRRAPLQIALVGESFERVALDITGPHPRSRKGNVWILTILDIFSKWALAFPIRHHDAITVSKILIEKVFTTYGTPRQLLSDRGKEFESHLMMELCKQFEIEKLRTVSYKPSTNGAIERFHRTLNQLIGKVVREDQRDWDECLPYVMAAYRATKHDSTGFSPNYLMFGREVNSPISLVLGKPADEKPEKSYLDVVSQRVQKFERAYETTRRSLNRTAERNKINYDLKVRKIHYEIGTWVWYYNPRRYCKRSPKWQKLYTGPFMIIQNVGEVNVKLQKSPRSKSFITHIDKIKSCLNCVQSSWLKQNDESEQIRNKNIPHEVVGERIIKLSP